MIKRIFLICFFSFIFLISGRAQFTYGTTGLLNMPTADMQRENTFLFGGSYLHDQATPKHFSYNTFNYYLNLTVFPWLEVAYIATLHKGVPGNYWPEHTWGKFTNQDRQFAARLRLWKEGRGKAWMPQIVLGVNDVGTHEYAGGGDIVSVGETGNGYWQRFYLAATKHIGFQGIGTLGVHAAYVYNKRKDYHLNGPAVGANFQLGLPADNAWHKLLNGLNLMGEYDARTINVGASYAIWKEYINVIAEMTEGKYFSGGVFFRVHLK